MPYFHFCFTGPISNAEADFIRLLWEKNIPLVVMVTKLVEDKAVSNICVFLPIPVF